MPRIVWDKPTKRLFETGVNHCVLYTMNDDGTYAKGVAWNGITSIEENPSGAEETTLYADNIEYASLRSKEKFGGTINAYMYPDEWAECDGSKEVVAGLLAGQQGRKRFGLVYTTLIGNDAQGTDYGYKVHVIWNASASVSSKSHQTVNESPEAQEFSWEITANAVEVETEGIKPLSTVTIDSTKYTESAAKVKLDALLDTFYGTDPTTTSTQGTDPELPTFDEIVTALS